MFVNITQLHPLITECSHVAHNPVPPAEGEVQSWWAMRWISRSVGGPLLASLILKCFRIKLTSSYPHLILPWSAMTWWGHCNSTVKNIFLSYFNSLILSNYCLLQARGDSFWDILEESSCHTLQLPGPLKEILTTMGYDNVRSLQSFSEADFKVLEEFMRTKLHKILERKNSHMDEATQQ